MPYSIEHWTSQQWGVFVATVAAGLLAALLFDIRRRWLATAPAPAEDRPNSRWERRRRRAIADATGPLTPVIDPTEQLLVQEWHADATSDVKGSIAIADPLVDDDVRDALADALGRALEDFRVAVEPAMRTARLWTLQGGESYAANALRTWHIMEITGEIASPFAVHGGVGGARA